MIQYRDSVESLYHFKDLPCYFKPVSGAVFHTLVWFGIMGVSDLDLALLNECVYYGRDPSGSISEFTNYEDRVGNFGFAAVLFVQVNLDGRKG